MYEATDEELVRRARTGDQTAARILFDRYAPRLRAEARRRLQGILRRRVGTSDVVQEAYLAAYRSLDDFEDRGPGSFARWLQQILHHKVTDQVRLHVETAKRGGGRETSQDGDRTEADPPSPLPSPSFAAMGREGRDRLREAMSRLPEEYRNLLDCVHHSRMTLEEAGRATGRSANAACKVYGRAIRALARILRETSAP